MKELSGRGASCKSAQLSPTAPDQACVYQGDGNVSGCRISRQHERAEANEVVQMLSDDCDGDRQLQRQVFMNRDISRPTMFFMIESSDTSSQPPRHSSSNTSRAL